MRSRLETEMHIEEESRWSLKRYGTAGPGIAGFAIEPCMRMDQENGTESTNIVSKAVLLLCRYPYFGFFCHAEGSDVRRNRHPLILDFVSIFFVVRPACGRVLTRLRRCCAKRFESERFESEQCRRQQQLSE